MRTYNYISGYTYGSFSFVRCLQFCTNWTPVHQKHTYQKYIQIYPRYIQDIQYKCIIPSGPGPAQPKPGPSPGPRTGRPGIARPWALAGLGPAWPAAAPYFGLNQDIFGYIWTYISYISSYFLWYTFVYFGIFFVNLGVWERSWTPPSWGVCASRKEVHNVQVCDQTKVNKH